MLFSSANGISETEKKTTITPEHVLAAIEQLELSLLKEPVTSFMQTLKESKGKSLCLLDRWLRASSKEALATRPQ